MNIAEAGRELVASLKAIGDLELEKLPELGTKLIKVRNCAQRVREIALTRLPQRESQKRFATRLIEDISTIQSDPSKYALLQKMLEISIDENFEWNGEKIRQLIKFVVRINR